MIDRCISFRYHPIDEQRIIQNNACKYTYSIKSPACDRDFAGSSSQFAHFMSDEDMRDRRRSQKEGRVPLSTGSGDYGTLLVNAKDRIILALDVDTQEEALSLADRLSGHVGAFKVSLRLFSTAGPQIVSRLQEMGQVFIDLKLHDIPSTVAAAGRALTRLGCSMLTAHAAGGAVMLKELVSAVSDESRKSGMPAPTVLAVTVLTSINQRQLEEDMLISNMLVRDAAMRFANRAQSAKVGGVVCSASEIAAVRATCGQDFKIVTSGIRPTWHGSNDQKRIDTPYEAIKRGADYVVIGRPITRAPHPVAAAQTIAEEIECAITGFEI